MFDVESYKEYLQSIIAANHDDCWFFEVTRNSTEQDYYKAQRLSQVLDILLTCDSLFTKCYKPNAILSDFTEYWEYIFKLRLEYDYNTPEYYILDSLLHPISVLRDI